MLEPLAAILDEFALAQVKEEFNGGCTVEIATFDKFTDFLGNNSYDLIVFDTAPTGHTLRLMTLPNEWDKYIQKSSQGSGQTCIGPVSQIEGARKKYEHAVNVMQDAAQTKVYLVSRPEKTSVYETFRAKTELERTGIHHFHLIINGIFPNHGTTSGIFAKMAENQKNYIAELHRFFGQETTEVPMQQSEVKGLENILKFGEIAFEGKAHTIRSDYADIEPFQSFASPDVLMNKLSKVTDNRVVILTGKGGVGKTVTACAVASRLKEKGKTLLLTTDPAAHIGQVLEAEVNHIPTQIKENLWAVNIDQKSAVEEYRKKILDDARSQNYTPELLAALEEELESPCTEEIAIFEQFANLLNEPEWDYFVLDTAPTGHTLRLLELPFEYQQQIDAKKKPEAVASAAVKSAQGNDKIEKLIERLKNSDKTTFMLVAYPEFTPLNEGHRAMKDLERVGITVQGVMLNHILNQDECPDDFSRERWKLQQHYLHTANKLFNGKPLFAIPLSKEEIIGLRAVETLKDRIFSSK
jgi:arsenite-transporting ATPase